MLPTGPALYDLQPPRGWTCFTEITTPEQLQARRKPDQAAGLGRLMTVGRPPTANEYSRPSPAYRERQLPGDRVLRNAVRLFELLILGRFMVNKVGCLLPRPNVRNELLRICVIRIGFQISLELRKSPLRITFFEVSKSERVMGSLFA